MPTLPLGGSGTTDTILPTPPPPAVIKKKIAGLNQDVQQQEATNLRPVTVVLGAQSQIPLSQQNAMMMDYMTKGQFGKKSRKRKNKVSKEVRWDGGFGRVYNHIIKEE